MPFSPEKMREIRTARGISQKRLADRISVHWMSVSRWERGWTSPHISRVEELAAALEVRMDELFGEPSHV